EADFGIGVVRPAAAENAAAAVGDDEVAGLRVAGVAPRTTTGGTPGRGHAPRGRLRRRGGGSSRREHLRGGNGCHRAARRDRRPGSRTWSRRNTGSARRRATPAAAAGVQAAES